MISFALLLAGTLSDWRQPSGWSGLEENGTCFISQTFEGKGESELSIYGDKRGIFFGVTNANWSAREGQQYQASFVIGGKVFDGTAGGLGQSGDSKRGVFIRIRPSDLGLVSSAPSVAVFLGDRFIDKLSLAGSEAAIAHFRSCMQAIETESARTERERKRWDDRPDDPFRGAATSDAGTAARIAGYFGSDNYPPSAIRAGASGAVRVRLSIAADGRVEECSVIGSSGNDDLDATTCRIMRSNVRLGDLAGQAIEQTVDWKLPETEKVTP